MIAKIALISALLLAVAVADRQPPVWPNQWEAKFTEKNTYPIIGTKENSGSFFYDWTNNRYRVDRDDGKFDRYCGSVYKFTSTPCSHIVTEGKRYLYFPEKDYCCYCCDAAHGCGLTRPDWVGAAGGQFYGYTQTNDGKTLQKWEVKGLQSNFYLASNDEAAVPYEIDQGTNDFIFYKPETYKLGISNPDVFKLPSKCNAKTTCPFISVCTAVMRKSL